MIEDDPARTALIKAARDIAEGMADYPLPGWEPWMESAGDWLQNLQELIAETLLDGMIITSIHLDQRLVLAPGLTYRPRVLFTYPVEYGKYPVKVSVGLGASFQR